MKTINTGIEILNENGICIGCMNKNRKMFYDDRIKECFKLIANIDIPDGLLIQVCWECMAYINNIYKFRSTIEHSYEVLLNYSMKDQSLLKLDEVPQRLQLASHQLVDIPCEYGVPIIHEEIDEYENSCDSVSEPDIYNDEIKEEVPETNVTLCNKKLQEMLLKRCEVRLERMQIMKGSYICDYCKKHFNRKTDFIVHIRLHRGEKIFRCVMCAYKCSKQHHLQKHMLNHVREDLFACDSCTYTCASKKDMEKHAGSHKKAKFYCLICFYTSKTNSTLVRHMQMHSRAIFRCKQCLYESKDRSSFKSHLCRGREALSCDYCSYKCKTSSDLKKHMIAYRGQNHMLVNSVLSNLKRALL